MDVSAILNKIPPARRESPAVKNLIADAIAWNDPVWAAQLVNLIDAYDTDPRAGAMCAAHCGRRASTICNWCPSCAKSAIADTVVPA